MIFIQLLDQYLTEYLSPAMELLKPTFERKQAYGVKEITEGIKNGEMQLWGAFKDKLIGCVVTSVDEGSEGRICTIIKLAGEDFKEWGNLMEATLNDFARINNCDTIEALTRKGFSKLLPNFKLQPDVLLIKQVV